MQTKRGSALRRIETSGDFQIGSDQISQTTNSGLVIALVLILAFPVLAVPLFTTHTLPLLDVPDHIARIHILANNGRDPQLAQFYVVNWQFLPNLALEVLAVPLAKIVSADMAIRITILISFILIASGALFLHRAVNGRWSPWPLVVLLLLYNPILIHGFLSYLIALGLWLWAFGLWIHYRHRSWYWRLPLFSALTMVLLTAHLYGAALYGVAVACYELSQHLARRPWFRRPDEDLVVGALQFAAPLGLFLWLSPTSGASHEIYWATLYVKLASLGNVVELYQPAAQLALLLLGVIVAMFFLRRRWAVLAPHSALTLAVMVLIFLALPQEAYSSWFVTERFPIAMALFAVCVFLPRFPSPRATRRFAVVVLVLATVQSAFITYRWHTFDRMYGDFYRLTERLPIGARVASLIGHSGRWYQALSPPLAHLADVRVVDKRIFLPDIFADPYAQPIAFTSKGQQLLDLLPRTLFTEWSLRQLARVPSRNDARSPFRDEVLANYDYLLIIHSDEFPARLLEGLPKPIARAGVFELIATGRQQNALKVNAR